MTRIHSRCVECDFCPARFIHEGGNTYWPLLKAAKDAGWTRFAERDSCPACPRKDTMADTLTGHNITRATEAFHALNQANPDFYGLMADMAALQVRKGHDYASAGAMEPGSNLLECEKIDVPAWKGILIRMSDKWMRLTHFARRGFVKDQSEGIEDTLMDMAVYSLLCILAYRRAKSADKRQWPGGTAFEPMEQRTRNAAQAGVKPYDPKNIATWPLKEVPSRLVSEMENPGLRGAAVHPTERRNS